MRSINFKSDFKLIESGTDFSVPFIFEYNTRGGRTFTASHIDGVYTNCKRMDDGRLLVIFDRHGMGIGNLVCSRQFFLSDKDYSDGICHLHDCRNTGVMLTIGETDDTDITVALPPYYQQGDKGDPLTWDTMTDEQKKELEDAVAKQVLSGQISTEEIENIETIL
ncbi:MAG: hypothetical protein Q4F50_17495 [Bacteroides sp.]|uniref:hypothetical protein n=1 Tax=Bacteroides sp. TaxID=29523 RepID=UPI0026DF1CF6|nr:hypothetical protein [Bacteroides sp.]MDO5421830.1 hypothetical protein [Bacteroides sp.]